MHILTARRYPNSRLGPLTAAQLETRRLAYSVKDPAGPAVDFDTVGAEMALLITGPCWLVPIPNSTCDDTANRILCSHIARYCAGAQIAIAICRKAPIDSQCLRHKRNLPSTPAAEHHLARTGIRLGLRQVYFVDNVSTSGNTLFAAHDALTYGAGLVFAAVGVSHQTKQPDLF